MKTINFLKFKSVLEYLQIHFKDDMLFGLSFISFSSLANYTIAYDRIIITKLNLSTNYKSRFIYTADQVTKVINTLLFPINTKVSGKLGRLYREKQYAFFHKEIDYSVLITLGIGTTITLLGYVIFSGINFFGMKMIIEPNALIQYSISNVLYLSAVLLQKKFDYSKFLKFLPLLLLLTSFFITYIFRKIFFNEEVSFFLIVSCFYFILLFISVIIIKYKRHEFN